MGTDIHWHAEVKINGQWEHLATWRIPRNYMLFSKMAGVRGIETPISKQKGIPADVTTLTRFDYDHWGSDAHSATWLDADEINKLMEWILEVNPCQSEFDFMADSLIFGYLFGNSWKAFDKYPEYRPKGLEDIRFVFWFDN